MIRRHVIVDCRRHRPKLYGCRTRGKRRVRLKHIQCCLSSDYFGNRPEALVFKHHFGMRIQTRKFMCSVFGLYMGMRLALHLGTIVDSRWRFSIRIHTEVSAVSKVAAEKLELLHFQTRLLRNGMWTTQSRIPTNSGLQSIKCMVMQENQYLQAVEWQRYRSSDVHCEVFFCGLPRKTMELSVTAIGSKGASLWAWTQLES